jgi:tetratricopeptide (TPR) repeat protein
VGTIPTSLITVGIVGLLAWIGFILLFIFGGLRALRSRYREMSTFEQSLSLSSFVGALYCWTSAIFGTVGVVPFTSAFVFTGLFLGLLSSFGSWQVKEYSYLREPQKGFTIVVILLCLLGSSIALGYQISQRTRAFFAYHQAVDSATAGKIEAAEAEFVKALSIAPNDSYYRSYSALNSYKAQQLVSRTDLSPDDLRSQFGLSFKASIESAQKAIAFDGENYLNWISLGNAYAMIVPFGIEKISDDAYSQAVDVYEKAAQRSPLNPQIPYILTTLAVSHNKPDEAREYAKRALDLKNDNPDALILLSQIEDNSGRPKDALALMEGAPAAEFSNPQVLFQLGYLRYKTGNYQAAVSALEKAVKAIPDYANAKYFLGLSYFENADKEKALKEFSDIKRLNPGRADITQIIKNIQNGYAPIGTPSKKENSDGSKNSTTTTKNKI